MNVSNCDEPLGAPLVCEHTHTNTHNRAHTHTFEFREFLALWYFVRSSTVFQLQSGNFVQRGLDYFTTHQHNVVDTLILARIVSGVQYSTQHNIRIQYQIKYFINYFHSRSIDIDVDIVAINSKRKKTEITKEKK